MSCWRLTTIWIGLTMIKTQFNKRFFYLLLIFFCGSALVTAQDGTQRLIIFYTNDVHGGITEQEADFLNPDFPPILGGGAAAANIIFRARKEAEKRGDIVLVLDAGDIFQGTPLGTKTEGKAIIEYMNRVGYDAATAGNHDFDLGKEVFINLTKMANFPYFPPICWTGKPGRFFLR